MIPISQYFRALYMSHAKTVLKRKCHGRTRRKEKKKSRKRKQTEPHNHKNKKEKENL